MNDKLQVLAKDAFPPLLHEIPEPPRTLYLQGTLPPPDHQYLTVVGSRRYSSYGKQVVDTLISGLRNQPVSIVSGLALGIDKLAHEAALKNNLHTVAVPGSGLDKKVLYPRNHTALAQRILDSGGALLSEFEPDFVSTPWSFPKRNRIMAGMAPATLIIEATKKSGTLITARMAVDYNRDLLVVPGSIFARNTEGPHLFMRLGAIPITSPEDLGTALGLNTETQENHHAFTPEEQRVIDALGEPRARDALIQTLNMDTQAANILLTQMELEGHIKEINGHIQLVL